MLVNAEEYAALVKRLNDSQEPTPSLDVYRAAEEFDGNFVWRIPHGHLVNFLEQAIEKLDHAIIMGDPPPDGRRPPRQKRELELDQIAEQLKKTPGEWALVQQSAWASNTQRYQRRGLQTRVRKSKEVADRWDIYARYPEGSDDV